MARIGKFILWSFAALGALLVVSVVGLAIVIGMAEDESGLPEKFVLMLDLNQGVVEKRSAVSLDVLEDDRSGLVLRDIVGGIGRAATDPRVRGLVLRLGNSGVSIAQAQEIRDAVAQFRKSGKVAFAHTESFANGAVEYYLAAAAGAVWLQPSGELPLTGLALEMPFFKDALEELDIEPLIGQRHEYKGAAESLTRASMSEPVRRSMKLLVDDWLAQIVDGLAADRKLAGGKVEALIDRGPYSASAAKREGLVDRLAYWTDLKKEMARRVVAEGGPEIETPRFIPLKRYRDDLPQVDKKAPKAALITAEGAIVMGRAGRFEHGIIAGDDLASVIAKAAADDGLKGLLIRIDSPGGVYTASDKVWQAIEAARKKGKKIVVSMGGSAASGGYFIAMAADRIVAQPGTVTGSIGVYGGKLNLKGFWRKLGVKWDEVHAGKHATMWSPNRGYPDGAEARVAQLLDEIYADFTAKAAKARGLSEAAMDKLARGRVWTGRQALAGKLIDRLGGLKTAEAELKNLLGLPAGRELQLLPMPAPKSRFELIAELLSGDAAAVELRLALGAALGGGWDRAASPVLRRLRDFVPPVGRLQMPPFRLKQ